MNRLPKLSKRLLKTHGLTIFPIERRILLGQSYWHRYSCSQL
jgi:hypothetical protein